MVRRAVIGVGATLAFAVGRFTHHRLITGLALVVIAAAVGGSAYIIEVSARGEQQKFDGTTAYGSHQFWANSEEDKFCGACHDAIDDELAASGDMFHKNQPCAFCHDPAMGSRADQTRHVATVAKCADCHSGGPAETNFAVGEALETDAHGGFYDSIGETAATASWSCKACHTYIEITMDVTLNPEPLHLPMLGPSYLPEGS